VTDPSPRGAITSTAAASSWTAVIVLAIALLAGCAGATSTSPAPGPAADRGRVPIPTPAPTTPLTATPDHPQLARMGDAVAVDADPAHTTVLTAWGPDLQPPPSPGATPAASAPATMTITARGVGATAAGLQTGSFAVHDEQGHDIPLRTDPLRPDGAAETTGTVLALHAVLPAGQGVLTWSPNGRALVSWTFHTEPD